MEKPQFKGPKPRPIPKLKVFPTYRRSSIGFQEVVVKRGLNFSIIKFRIILN